MSALRQWGWARWRVECRKEPPLFITTEGAVTWALRVLVRAPSGVVRPTDGPRGRWSNHIATLRALGVKIKRSPSSHGSRSGWKLDCIVMEDCEIEE